MKDGGLRSLGLVIAVLAGCVAVAAVFAPPVHQILFPATLFVAAMAVLLFLRMLFSRTYREGVKAVNRQMGDGQPMKRFGDPHWGVFGRRVGEPVLLWVRLVLVLGIPPLGLLMNVIGKDVLLLWFAGSCVIMEVSIMYAALRTPSDPLPDGTAS